jgi:hypothetical protein
MAENPRYRELLQLLNEFEVEYLIVGGFAVMKCGEPRYRKDLDVWVHNSAQKFHPCRWSAQEVWCSPRARWDHGADVRREASGLSDRNCAGQD